MNISCWISLSLGGFQYSVCFSKASFVFAIHSVRKICFPCLFIQYCTWTKSSVFCQKSTKCKCESVCLCVLHERVCCARKVWRVVCEIKVRACDLTGIWSLSAVTHTNTLSERLWSVYVCLFLRGQCVFTQMG
jgi:hypothetical protein